MRWAWRPIQPHGPFDLSPHLQDFPLPDFFLSFLHVFSPLYCFFGLQKVSHQIFEILLGSRHCIRHLEHKIDRSLSSPNLYFTRINKGEWSRGIINALVKGDEQGATVAIDEATDCVEVNVQSVIYVWVLIGCLFDWKCSEYRDIC